MDKQTLINRLLQLPDLLKYAEENVIKASEAIQEAKAALLVAEDMCLVNGLIDGKNAEIRAAQLREKTSAHRTILQEKENLLSRERAALNHLANEFKALGLVAGMLKGAE